MTKKATTNGTTTVKTTKAKKTTAATVQPTALSVSSRRQVDHAQVLEALGRIREAVADLLSAAHIESVDSVLCVRERYRDEEHEIDVSSVPSGKGNLACLIRKAEAEEDND